MSTQNPLSRDSSGQMMLLIGFIIALVIIGMSSMVYSLASSNPQSTHKHSSMDAYYSFINIREDYGMILKFVSNSGAYSPFNSSNTTIKDFESNMNSTMASHGYILTFTRGPYFNNMPPTAEATILLFDGKNRFEDTVTYDLETGRIMYDLVPPGSITDLHAFTGVNDGEIILNWTAMGDDGNIGKASDYNLKYSIGPVDTMAKFANATHIPVNFYPDFNGTPQEYIVMGLEPGRYYFALVVYDEVLQASNLSNCCPNAVAANWTPSVGSVISNDTVNSGTNLTTERGRDVTIMFNVTDKDREALDISLWLDNGSGWYAIRYTGQTWGQYNTTIYNHTIFQINTTWRYYVSVTDGLSGHNATLPHGSPSSYYWIWGNNSTGAGMVTIINDSVSTINLSAPYSDDFNNNNEISVLYRINSSGSWDSSNVTYNRLLTEYLIFISGLNNTNNYDVNITYIDPDGIYPVANVTGMIWNQTLPP
ncbi:MAG: hypothetical protein M8353_00590 [ANME-2 cluster archaeon]|nr:hypothetical protein [ANME-2 cluster archaeon]